MNRIYLILLLSISLPSLSQQFVNRGGGLYHEESFDIETDDLGNSYTTRENEQ